MSDPILLVANWKMNGDRARVQTWAYGVNAALSAQASMVRAVFCPPTAYLATAKLALPGNAELKLGAQNCYVGKQGAYTGEVSAPMLKDIGCNYVIIGHSERRAMGETDVDVAAKASAVVEAGLMPIICVGESREDCDHGRTKQALDTQLAGLKTLTSGTYIIAYEPIWAIGAGTTPKAAEIETTHSHIKSVLGSDTRVLYGGSVNVGNAGEILGLASVAGALIGGASLEIESMGALITAAATTRRK